MKLTIVQRMALLTGTALVGVLSMTLLGQFQVGRAFDQANYNNANTVPSVVVLDDLRKSVLLSRELLVRRVLDEKGQQQAGLETQLQDMRRNVDTAFGRYVTDGCFGISCISDDQDRNIWQQGHDLWLQVGTRYDEILKTLHGGERDAASARQQLNDLEAASTRLQLIISKHIEYNIEVGNKATQAALAYRTEAVYLELGIGLAMLAVIASIGFLTSRTLMRQLGGEPGDAAHVAQELAAGDLSHRPQLRDGDQKSLMARIQFIFDMLERLALRADAVGQGNLDDEVVLASRHDRLGMAINNMVRALRQVRDEDKRRNWMKDGLRILSTQLAGDLSGQDLANAAIECVGRYLEAGRGVLYLYSASSKGLDLMGSYMYTERQRVGEHFSEGEGAVGQVARERKPIVLTLANDDTPLVVTGTTSAAPRMTYTYPLLHERELVGVLELACMRRFNAVELEFLETVTEMIAASLYVAEQRANIRRMLEAAEASEAQMREQNRRIQEANERLEMQQQQLQQQTEELQQSNAQMEEQQQQLQQQAEELMQTNVQMEEAQTQLQQQNAELENSRKQLDQRARDLDQAGRYKSEFLANMSHELRTPLNSIIVLSKMMSGAVDGQVRGEALKWADVIHRSGQDLLRLINDVLDLSKVEAGRMELVIDTVRSDELCGELQGLFEPVAAEKGVALVIDDQWKGSFQTDEAKLSQILRNLLTNAFKFCKQGSVTLSLARVADSRRPLRISVRDTGIGIPKAKLSLIFEAFTQADGSTSREYGGTGLGLTISQRFAELLGGRIEVQSVEGQGSEFCLLLPDHPDAGPPRSAVEAGTGPAAVRASELVDDRETVREGDCAILLIDDDSTFCQALLALNQGLGYKTLLAHTGAQGLQMAQRWRPRGILLDLGLPDMDGSRVLHELKSRRELASIPVYVVSARDRDEALLRQGAVGYLQKPADPERLAEVQAELLAMVDADEGARMLVLENGGISAQTLQTLLSGRAVRVEAASDGDTLCDQFRASQQSQDAYRLVVLDVPPQSPGGVEQALHWARGLRALATDLPLVFHCRQPLQPDEESQLRQLSSCIIMASSHAAPRLLANVERFLREVPRAAVDMRAAGHPPADGQALKGRHVLVVDDDPRNIFVMTAALERQGAQVDTAINGKRALEFLGRQLVDVILMDLMMPEMDGYEAISHIRADARMAQTPIIVITAKAAPTERTRVMSLGANDYLSKPIDYDMMVAMVDRWCERSPLAAQHGTREP